VPSAIVEWEVLTFFIVLAILLKSSMVVLCYLGLRFDCARASAALIVGHDFWLLHPRFWYDLDCKIGGLCCDGRESGFFLKSTVTV